MPTKAVKPPQRHAGGRPPKFDEPRRPVTVTLPERTLRRLGSVDADLARAIVKAAEIAAPESAATVKPVETVEVSEGVTIILVAPSRCLRQIPWLRLAEVGPGRHLLTVVPGTPVESLESAILDLLEVLPPDEAYEQALLEELYQLIRTQRRDEGITKFEMLYLASPRPATVRRT